MKYVVDLLILNKDGVRDPEGEAVNRFALSKRMTEVLDVRVGKTVRLVVEAVNKDEVKEKVLHVAKEARLFNPIVHKVEVFVREDSSN